MGLDSPNHWKTIDAQEKVGVNKMQDMEELLGSIGTFYLWLFYIFLDLLVCQRGWFNSYAYVILLGEDALLPPTKKAVLLLDSTDHKTEEETCESQRNCSLSKGLSSKASFQRRLDKRERFCSEIRQLFDKAFLPGPN